MSVNQLIMQYLLSDPPMFALGPISGPLDFFHPHVTEIQYRNSIYQLPTNNHINNQPMD